MYVVTPPYINDYKDKFFKKNKNANVCVSGYNDFDKKDLMLRELMFSKNNVVVVEDAGDFYRDYKRVLEKDNNISFITLTSVSDLKTNAKLLNEFIDNIFTSNDRNILFLQLGDREEVNSEFLHELYSQITEKKKTLKDIRDVSFYFYDYLKLGCVPYFDMILSSEISVWIFATKLYQIYNMYRDSEDFRNLMLLFNMFICFSDGINDFNMVLDQKEKPLSENELILYLAKNKKSKKCLKDNRKLEFSIN